LNEILYIILFKNKLWQINENALYDENKHLLIEKLVQFNWHTSE